MEVLAKEILNYLGNKHTKIEVKKEFKGNYYSYLNDTIYVAQNFVGGKSPNKAKNINKEAAKLVVMCHECIHSNQSKCMHILNLVFSNFSIFFTLIYIIVAIFSASALWLKLIAIIAILASIIVRLILEIDAVNGSVKLARQIVAKNKMRDVSKQDVAESTKYIQKYKCLALLQMISDKIIFLILVLII